MQTEVLIALLSFAGTAFGTLAGIFTSYKLIEYRVSKIEKALEQVDVLEDRMTRMETTQKIQEEYIQRIRDELDRNSLLTNAMGKEMLKSGVEVPMP